MIFAPPMIIAILEGHKTQTRRRITLGRPCPYRVGSTYSVQSGRGKAGLARIRVLNVRSEPLWKLSDSDVQAEGFHNCYGFTIVWKGLHGDLNWDEEVWVIDFELVQP